MTADISCSNLANSFGWTIGARQCARIADNCSSRVRTFAPAGLRIRTTVRESPGESLVDGLRLGPDGCWLALTTAVIPHPDDKIASPTLDDGSIITTQTKPLDKSPRRVTKCLMASPAGAAQSASPSSAVPVAGPDPVATDGALGPAREPRPALRDEQTELTRRRILDAVVRILAENVADLSVEAVARESGVSRPTIYRYFSTKRGMVEAVGRLYAERTGTLVASDPQTLDEVLERVPVIFARYESIPAELRAAAINIGRLELAASYQVERLELSRRLIEPYVDDVPEADRERLAQVVTVLLSSGTFRSMRHYLDLAPQAAGELVAWAVRRLVEDSGRARIGGEEKTT